MDEIRTDELTLLDPSGDDERRQVIATGAEATDVATLLPSIRRRHASRITAELVVPAREGAYAELPPDLDPRIATALRARGIARLYSHQRAAWDAIRQGQHTYVETPTASGKTL